MRQDPSSPHAPGAPATGLADASLSAGLRERFGFLREVVAEMERSVPYAAALAGRTDGARVRLQDGEQTASRLDPRAGVVLTAWDGRRIEEASTDATDPAAVRALARSLVDRIRARPSGGAARLDGAIEIDPGAPLDADYATPTERDPASVSLADKLSQYEALRRHVRGLEPRAIQAICVFGEQSQQRVFVNRAKFVTQVMRRVILSLTLVVSDGQQPRWNSLQRGGTGGLELLETTDQDLAELAEGAALLLSARPCPPGMYDVVTDPDVSGTLAHEAFGHGVETDMFLKGRARGADYIGRTVGSDLVTIVDDPSVPGAYGSYFIDDEGQPASPTVIIRDGILQRGLTDLYSAAHLAIARSANGRRESIHHKAYARMSNTFFTPGPNKRQQLLDSLEHGLLLKRSINGMEDPKGWGIQIWAGYALEYRAGKPTGTVFAPISLTGYVPDLLADVSMVSDDPVAYDPGTCGKGWKELVPVGSGGPYLRTRCRVA